MIAARMALDDVDLLAANIGTDRDPHARYREARRAHPVARTAHLGAEVWTVYRYRDAEAVLRDGESFSNAINGRWMRAFLGRTILEMDGAEHLRYRGLIAHGFRPRAVTRWEEDVIRPTVEQAIEGFAARGRAELVRDFDWQVPVRVFARILGVPDVDHSRWQRWAVELERTSVDHEAGKRAAREVREYFEPKVAERRVAPTDDLISDLVHAEVDGHALDDDLIHGFVRLLVPAGAGTTYRLLGNLLFALLSAPERWEEVRADRSLVPGAVEEALRWESPVQFATREATRDAEVGGVEIPAGSAVITALGSANRDETRYEDPDTFDVHRRVAGHHLAFGSGNHFCLGAHLARLEAAVALNALMDRLPDLRLDAGDRDPHVMGWAFRSPNCLPVRFSAS